MIKVLRLIFEDDICRSEISRENCNLATALLIKGEAAHADMGDFAKGEARARKQEPMLTMAAFPAPGRRRLYLADRQVSVFFFKSTNDSGGPSRSLAMASAILDNVFQEVLRLTERFDSVSHRCFMENLIFAVRASFKDRA